MPRRDGTGPMGMGARRGRGMGYCHPNRPVGYNRGIRYRSRELNEKELLMEEKEILEERLEMLNQELENLND